MMTYRMENWSPAYADAHTSASFSCARLGRIPDTLIKVSVFFATLTGLFRLVLGGRISFLIYPLQPIPKA